MPIPKRISDPLIVLGVTLFVILGLMTTVNYLQSVKDDVRVVAEPMNMLTFMLKIHAERYYEATGTYDSFCTSEGAQSTLTSVPSVAGKTDCNDSPSAWAAGVILPLRGSYYCVDSQGAEFTTVRGLKPGETVCPAEQPWK